MKSCLNGTTFSFGVVSLSSIRPRFSMSGAMCVIKNSRSGGLSIWFAQSISCKSMFVIHCNFEVLVIFM